MLQLLTREALHRLTCEKLRHMLKDKGLPQTGRKKEDLIRRLLRAYGNDDGDEDDDDDDDDGDDDIDGDDDVGDDVRQLL